MNPINDASNFLRKATIAKFFNALKALISYYISRQTGNPVISHLPVALSVEPTTYCNLRCPQCPSGLRSFTRPTGMLDVPMLDQILADTHRTLAALTLYFQGEPYLNPNFFDFVQLANKYKIYTATSTNAHYLTPENCKRTIEAGLDRLVVSIDGASPDTYKVYRVGGDFNKAMEGVQTLVQTRKALKKNNPYIIFQFIVFKHNEHEIDTIKKLVKKIGVDYLQIKTAQVYDHQSGSDLLPTNPKYRRYDQTPEGRWKIANKLLNHCWKMWHSCVVTWDGSVVPCCFDKDASHSLGNIKKNSFNAIWFSDSYKGFRKSLLKSRSEIDICKNCSEGTKIWT